MKNIHIKAGTLVVLSGLPGSGKSSLRGDAVAPFQAPKNFIDGCWLSSDELRRKLFGEYLDFDEAGLFTRLPQDGNDAIFGILRAMVRARLERGLTVVVDACSPTEADRKEWADIAAEYGAPVKVLIMATSLQECLKADAARMAGHRTPEKFILEMANPPAPASKQVDRTGKPVPTTAPAGFTPTSALPFEEVRRGDTLVFEWPGPAHNRVDVIGDPHGMLDELLALLRKAGWSYENGKLTHPQGRLLLLLGDLVDRGPKSLELVRFVRQAVLDGAALCIKGNHESKLVRFYRRFTSEGVASWGSFTNAQTGLEFVQAKDGATLIEFLDRLPAFMTYVSPAPHPLKDGQPLAKLLFAHANLLHAVPGVTHQSDYLYGQTGWQRGIDTDAKYQEHFEKGTAQWTLVRGHVPQTSPQENAFSLERQAFQNGELVMLRLDQFEEHLAAGDSQLQAFGKSILTQACHFDFEASRVQFKLAQELSGLVTAKMATGQLDESNRLRVFKYSKETFWKNRWNESPALLKARGIVLDAAGAIVSHPFDKCFNLHEGGAGDNLAGDTPLVVVDKLNGFLGIVSLHPFEKNQLLVHTQGGFGGPFVGYIKDFLTPALSGQVKKYLHAHNVTLMFEVVHPQDPHIIEYQEADQGLWLIGVRGKKEEDLAWTEEQVDEAAKAMGLRRPGWTRMSKDGLLALCRTQDGGLAKVEGWMARADTAQQEHLFKLKTPYYLVTKFLGRLSDKRISHMFDSPNHFKETVDEEFYPLVNALVARSTKEGLQAMAQDARVSLVRGLVHELI